jgi:hypothetical protein
MVRRLISTLRWMILLAGLRGIIEMQIRSVGIDLGKTTFHLVALSAAGKVLVRKKFTQKQLITFTANMQISLVGMEACSGAHFLGRVLREQGHDVKLIPAQFVKPFVKSNKNDFLDAEAITEAVGRQNMRFVPIRQMTSLIFKPCTAYGIDWSHGEPPSSISCEPSCSSVAWSSPKLRSS